MGASTVLLNRIWLYAGQTYERFYDFNTREAAQAYYDRNHNSRLFDTPKKLHRAMFSYQRATEVQARLRWDELLSECSVCIFIKGDFSRLQAQLLALDLKNRLRQRAEENGMPFDERYVVPISYYDDDRKSVSLYSAETQTHDLARVESSREYVNDDKDTDQRVRKGFIPLINWMRTDELPDRCGVVFLENLRLLTPETRKIFFQQAAERSNDFFMDVKLNSEELNWLIAQGKTDFSGIRVDAYTDLERFLGLKGSGLRYQMRAAEVMRLNLCPAPVRESATDPAWLSLLYPDSPQRSIHHLLLDYGCHTSWLERLRTERPNRHHIGCMNEADISINSVHRPSAQDCLAIINEKLGRAALGTNSTLYKRLHFFAVAFGEEDYFNQLNFHRTPAAATRPHQASPLTFMQVGRATHLAATDADTGAAAG